MSFLRVAARTALPRLAVAPVRVQPRLFALQRAQYATGAGLSKETIQTRVLEVLKGFEKVDQAKVRYSYSQPC
jgi:NADH dehydrogenase (ubiquinone) 1 alpha/beta subcomplex 1, acyl-carrier protein